MARFVLFYKTDIIRKLRFMERATMNEHEKNKLMELCRQIVDEQDPEKFTALVLQINILLEVKELRLEVRTTNLPSTQ
jgi:hypothetical protein